MISYMYVGIVTRSYIVPRLHTPPSLKASIFALFFYNIQRMSVVERLHHGSSIFGEAKYTASPLSFLN